MKIAGTKNTGAWFRFNKRLQTLTEAERADMHDYLISNLLFLDAVFNDTVSLATEAGITNGAFPTTSSQWLSTMLVEGIPLQIWMGKPTFTTYTRAGTTGHYTYTANYVSNRTQFANELRGFSKRWIHAMRQLRDVYDVGTKSENNPGGLPNADPTE